MLFIWSKKYDCNANSRSSGPPVPVCVVCDAGKQAHVGIFYAPGLCYREVCECGAVHTSRLEPLEGTL